MNVTNTVELETYLGLPGTENEENEYYCTDFTQRVNFFCAFPGPKWVTFLRIMLFCKHSIKKILLRDEGDGDVKKIISFISVRGYCFVFVS